MKDETARVEIKEFDRLKPKMNSFLVDNSSEDKKANSVNKNVVATLSHNEYKDILLKQRMRHLMNRIQSKNQQNWKL